MSHQAQTRPTTVAQAVGTAVAQLGATHVFTLLGSGNFAVTLALRDAGARVVSARHETAAVTMADAYARVSGEVGVVTVHRQPRLRARGARRSRASSRVRRTTR